MMTEQDKKGEGRLIILGGGIAALTAAFYASEDGHEKVFPGGIHVYERTDRLGGKGASSRSTSDKIVDRIEEHGLHVWFGSYDNAFALLKKCHDLLEKKPIKDRGPNEGGDQRWATSLLSVEDGFRPSSRVGLMDYDGTSWLPWVADFPEDATARPWQHRDEGAPFQSPLDLAVRALQLVEAFMFSMTSSALVNADSYSTFLDFSMVPFPVGLPRTEGLSKLLNHVLRSSTAENGGLTLVSRALALLTQALGQVRTRLDELLRQHDSMRRSLHLAEVVLAAVRGLLDDGVLTTGDYSLIDNLDLRAWLTLHGASRDAVDCAFLKAIVYDLGFAYEDGVAEQPSFSAASAVYVLLRMLLTYRGAIMWKMNAGMGEIVFAPIYEALIARGVQINFGSEVTSVAVEARGAHYRAARVEFKRSACRETNEKLWTIDVPSGPLAGELPYWDSRQKGEAKAETIELGRHDTVVYGLPVGTIENIVKEAPQGWLDCHSRVKSIPTVALQLWLAPAVDRYAHWASPDITVGAYTEPFDTWADMKTLAGEKWRGAAGSVAYFANAAPKSLTDESLKGDIDYFIENGLASLWPHFDKNMIVDQFSRLNNDDSERYTLALPGTLSARLSPLDKTIINVKPVGDWTRNSISAGCIEAAVISGMIAVLALRPDRELAIFGEDTEQLRRKI